MIDDFIKKLRQIKSTNNSTNQYSKEIKNSDITINNLRLYLNYINKQKPKYLFVGEAPGYNGCRITGIPFTSEYILTQNYGKGMFGKENGYKIINTNKPQKEPTATIIWEIFSHKKILPCFWNAFPFHPYKDGNPLSNREPDKSEKAIGLNILLELVDILRIKNFIAIGKVSYNMLIKNGIRCEYIRHPANGGKSEFIMGLKKIKDL